MKYYAIYSNRIDEVVGVCTSILDVFQEDSTAYYINISKKDFNEYGDNYKEIGDRIKNNPKLSFRELLIEELFSIANSCLPVDYPTGSDASKKDVEALCFQNFKLRLNPILNAIL